MAARSICEMSAGGRALTGLGVLMQRKIIGFLYAMFCLAMCACNGPQPQNYVTSDGVMLGTFMKVTAQTSRPVVEIYDSMMMLDVRAKASMSIFDEQSRLNRLNHHGRPDGPVCMYCI